MKFCLFFQILHEEWLGQPWDTTNNSERIVKAIVLPLLVICFPVISILLWFTLCCCRKLPGIRLLTSPRIRFWSFSFSYVFFLYVLFCVCTYEKGRAELGPPSFCKTRYQFQNSLLFFMTNWKN